jgi:hypothetical protein
MGENPTRVLRYGVFMSLEHTSTLLLEYMVPLTNVFAWVIFWAVFVQETFNFYVMLHQKIKSFVSRIFSQSGAKANDAPQGKIFFREMFCLLATLLYLLGELPNFRSKTRIQSIVSDLANQNQNQSQAAGSILKEIIQKSFEEIKDDLKEMIQEQAKQPFQQNKKPLLNQDLFETKIDQLKKDMKQTQLQQFHEIRNQQRQLLNQQSRESEVSLMSQEYALWQYRLSIFQGRITK